jgi:ornithine cyclodeaminase/alanine dehydrogenase-like protein (mu-crystallin family)
MGSTGSPSSQVLFLSSEDLQGLIDMKEGVDLVEQSFRLHFEGRCVLAPRSRQKVEKHQASVLLQAAHLEGDPEILMAKMSADYPENPSRFGRPSVSGLICYLDAATGVPLGIFDSTYLSAVRTGGNGALGVKYLGRRDAEVVGVVGSGVQARAGLVATCGVRPGIRHALVYSPSRGHREEFARSMSRVLGVEVTPVEAPLDAVRNADVVYLATYAKEPPIRCRWLRPGTHVSSVGSQAEIDLDFFREAKVVVSDLKTVLETGVLAEAFRKGLIRESNVYCEMGALVAGVSKGRTSPREITLYVASGMAVQDAVVANVVYERALRNRAGRTLTYSPYGAFQG